MRGLTVDEAALREAGLIKRKVDIIKVLGDGELDRALTVKVHAASATANAKDSSKRAVRFELVVAAAS